MATLVNTSDGLVSGALGTIIDILFQPDSQQVKCIIINMDNPDSGRKQREQHLKYSAKYQKENGTPLFLSSQEYNIPSWKRKDHHAAKASVVQFPLQLAWANTGHKMQVNFVNQL